jgi:hypothetical protein
MRVGIADHLGWAVAVTASAEFEVLGERAEQILQGPRAKLEPPGTQDHRTALAATIVVTR